MSVTAIETTRYAGLILTARELFDAHEEAGWRLANVIYDAVRELRRQEEGLPIAPVRNSDRMSATKRVALDVDRHRMSAQNVYVYYKLWCKFGDLAERHHPLTFGDHMVLANRAKSSPLAVETVAALKKRRAAINAGKRPEFGNANSAAAAARGGAQAGRGRDNFTRLVGIKSRLRTLLEGNVWDYPDHQKVLDYLIEIQDLLDQVKAKPWNPSESA